MRLVSLCCMVAPLLAACGRPPPAPPLLEPGMPANRVVATLDGEPIYLREVVEFSIQSDFDTMLRRYLLKQVAERKRKELGIEHTEQELYRRAKLQLDLLRAARGQSAVDERVRLSGLRSEEEYLRRFAKEDAVKAALTMEKIVAYSFLTQDAVEADLTALDSKEQAEKLARAAKESGERDLEKLTKTYGLDAVLFRTHWWLRGMLRTDLDADQEEALFQTAPGDVVGPLQGKRGFWFVAAVKARRRGTPAEYAAVKDQVFASILNDPPSQMLIERCLELLLRNSEIKRLNRR